MSLKLRVGNPSLGRSPTPTIPTGSRWMGRIRVTQSHPAVSPHPGHTDSSLFLRGKSGATQLLPSAAEGSHLLS